MDTTLALHDEENKENIREVRHILKTSVSPKEIWWSNMLLLGFCPAENERVYGVSFNPDMFEQTSTKGMQVVLYYLLRQISRDRTKKAFKNCWPTLDAKNNLNEYKKAAQQLITELEHEGEIPAGTFRLSHLQSLGARFYHLLWHLSVAALKGALAKKYSIEAPPKRAIDGSVYKQAGLIGDATKLRVARQRQRFVGHAQAIVAEQGEWREYGQVLETEYRSLTQQLNKLKEERKHLAASVDKVALEQTSDRRKKRIEQIKRVWDLFARHYEENAANRDNIQGKSSKLSLDQAELRSDLALFRQQLLSSSMSSPLSSSAQRGPSASRSLTYQECQQLLSVDPFRDDKLDLLTLIKLWRLYLSVVKNRVEVNPLLTPTTQALQGSSQLAEDAPMLTNILQAHQNHLGSLSAFNRALQEDLPTLQEETSKMFRLVPPEPVVAVPATPSRRPLGLQTPSRASIDSGAYELVPPTPDLSFERCLDETQEEFTQAPTQVAATPLPRREDQERMVDSIHRAAKQRRPRLSIGSGRTSGGSAMAMKKAMFARSKLTDEEREPEVNVLTSPLNTSGGEGSSGGSSSDGEERWGKPDPHGMELSPLREMTTQFTLNLGLFSPFGGIRGGTTANLAHHAFPPNVFASRRAPAPVPSPSPSSSPAESPFASDPLSFMDSFAAGPASSSSAAAVADRKPAKPAFKVEDDEAWLMKEESFVDHQPLQSYSTFSTDYGKDALRLGDEDVLAQLDDLDKEDDDDDDDFGEGDGNDGGEGLNSTRLVVNKRDVLSLMADKLTSNILREDEGWQEEALSDLSIALDELDDDALAGERTEQFSTNITALRNEAQPAQALGEEDEYDDNYNNVDDDDDGVGEADFDDLVEDELRALDDDDGDDEPRPEPEDAFVLDQVENLSVEIRESVREEAKKKRISLGFDLRELESDDDDEEEEEEEYQQEVEEDHVSPENGEKEEEEDGASEPAAANTEENEDEETAEGAGVGGEVNWSMAIESEGEEEEAGTGVSDDDEGDEYDEEEEVAEEINIEAEVEKAGGIVDDTGGSHAEETALGDYSVLDITFKPPREDGKEDTAVVSKGNDDLFADLQEELGEQEEEEEEEEEDEEDYDSVVAAIKENENVQEDEDAEGEEEKQPLDESFGGEVKSIDELIVDLSSAEARKGGKKDAFAPRATASTAAGTTMVDDIFFGLDDEEREAKEWDTFCSSPAISTGLGGGGGGGRRKALPDGKAPPQLGLSLLTTDLELELDETVMDGLLTPVAVGLHNGPARRLNAVTPSLHPYGGGSVTSPTRPRKKLSFSSLANSILAGDDEFAN